MCTFFVNKSIFILFITEVTITYNIRVNEYSHPNIDAKTKIELRPLTVRAFLYDVIRLSAPVINEESLYYLYKPNGDVTRLKIRTPRENDINGDEPTVWAKFTKIIKPILSQSNNYDVFSIISKGIDKDNDVFGAKAKKMEENEYMIGPLMPEDHGNWVLSIYTKDLDGNWVELFQVISITITEYLPLTPHKPKLNPGETFNISFAFPITSLESCELVAPRSTFDRLFDRRMVDMDKCGFSIPNINEKDMGLWKIIGVGKIAYEGEVYLTVYNSVSNSVNKSSSITYSLF